MGREKCLEMPDEFALILEQFEDQRLFAYGLSEN
jgi:hypothetical protein